MIRLNYIYFGFFFLALCFIHGFHALITESGFVSTRVLFMIPAFAQSFLEAFLLALLMNFARKKVWSKIIPVLVSLTIVLMLLHAVDLFMIRIMGVTIWYLLGSLLDESLNNFLEMIYASNIPLPTWCLILATALAIPTLGYYLYNFSHRLAEKKPYEMSYRKVVVIPLSISIGMLAFSLIVFPLQDHITQELLEQTLPWKTSFASSNHTFLSLQKKLKRPQGEAAFLEKLEKLDGKLEKKTEYFPFYR